MGFYYFIILFAGIFFIVKAVVEGVKRNDLLGQRVIILGVTGIILVSLASFLFTPGSSEIIAEILDLNDD